MRNRLLITALIASALLVISLVWFLIPRDHLSKTMETPPPATPGGGPLSAAVNQATPPPPLPPMASLEARQQAFNAAFKTPIIFFGRVIDQHNNPVPDADVKCYPNDRAWTSSSQYQRKSDSAGYFSIDGVVGSSLGVEVSKPGYLVFPWSDSRVTSSGLFKYAAGTGRHVPDRDNPVIFRLHKIGVTEPLVKIGEKNFRITRDGSPLSIAVDEQGAHQVVLRCWNQELQRPAGQRQYDWRLEVSVPNGGLQVRKDAFDFEAPQDGYAASDTVDMPASLGNQWRSFAERSYFIRFADGTFARAKMEMHPGGDHFVAWESFYNPKAGSPNLASPAPNQSALR